jgi:alkylation response protein AidB-like acyl-CoA dehydrogenase
MTITDEPVSAQTGLIDELHDWLRDNWDPDLTVAEWWERLGTAGWSNPILPPDQYGKGATRSEVVQVSNAIAEFGALGAPVGLGLNLAAPTIATHGTAAQKDRYIRDIVTGRIGWCQLFSEPGAGSDLAGLTTRAERDGEVWVVNGQKVWTSGGHFADMGMLLARTNPTAPKHQGISWFALDMHQAGVEVRPLKEMTGSTMFSEVFFEDAVAPDEAMIGDLNDGWKVANTTLAYERSGMGAGGRRTFIARAGTVAGDLDKRAGDFVRARSKKAAARAASPATKKAAALAGSAGQLAELARQLHKLDDATIRQDLMRSHILSEVQRFSVERQRALTRSGGTVPGLPNFSKLLSAIILRHNRDLGARILGPRATLHSYPGDDGSSLADAPGGNAAAAVTAQILSAQALPIFGGTDQIQHNILGERVLGLAKEPGDLSRLPFNEIPKNG